MNSKIDPDNIPKWLENKWSRNNYENVIAGINDDDCAVIKINNNENLVLTTDFLNASPISVELGICTNRDLGRLVVASNISDLCGTGAKPIGFMLGVTMAREDSEEDLFSLFDGVKNELDKLGIPLIGGDTKLGRSRAFIGTAIGTSDKKRKLFLKKNAKPNDIIWVSGQLGSISAAVYYLTNLPQDEKLKTEARRLILNSDVPIDKSNSVAILKVGNGGTDISDGLGADLHNMLDSSNVGCDIDLEKIPVSTFINEVAKLSNIKPWLFPFIIGGDFQFIVTTYEKSRSKMLSLGFFEIGRVTKNTNKNLIYNKKKIKLPDFGHRDGRKQKFEDEVRSILKELNDLID